MADKEKQQENEQESPKQTGTIPAKTEDQDEGKEPVKTFTQDEMNAIIKDRLDREREKHKKTLAEYGDYDDLKKAAEEWQKLQEAKKTDAEKWTEALTQKDEAIADWQRKYEESERERVQTLIRAAIVATAVAQGFTDPEDAYRLVNLSEIELDDESGEITGVREQLKALSEAKPYLLRSEATMTTTAAAKIPTTNPARGGAQGETDEQRRRRLWGTGTTPFGSTQGGGLHWPDKSGGSK